MKTLTKLNDKQKHENEKKKILIKKNNKLL